MGEFKHTLLVIIDLLVRVETTKIMRKEIDKLRYWEQSLEINEWFAPESYSAFKFLPLIKHTPWIWLWFSTTLNNMIMIFNYFCIEMLILLSTLSGYVIMFSIFETDWSYKMIISSIMTLATFEEFIHGFARISWRGLAGSRFPLRAIIRFSFKVKVFIYLRSKIFWFVVLVVLKIFRKPTLMTKSRKIRNF